MKLQLGEIRGSFMKVVWTKLISLEQWWQLAAARPAPQLAIPRAVVSSPP